MLLVASIVVTLLLVAGLVVIGARGARLELPRRPRHRILPGGKAVPEDLSQDASTDDQRFLM